MEEGEPRDDAAIAEVEKTVAALLRESRDNAAKAETIENAAYALKAVNSNGKTVVDARTPMELMDLIDAKGKKSRLLCRLAWERWCCRARFIRRVASAKIFLACPARLRRLPYPSEIEADGPLGRLLAAVDRNFHPLRLRCLFAALGCET